MLQYYLRDYVRMDFMGGWIVFIEWLALWDCRMGSLAFISFIGFFLCRRCFGFKSMITLIIYVLI